MLNLTLFSCDALCALAGAGLMYYSTWREKRDARLEKILVEESRTNDRENIKPYLAARIKDMCMACREIRRSIYFASDYDEHTESIGRPDIDYTTKETLLTRLQKINFLSKAPARSLHDQDKYWQEYFFYRANEMKDSIKDIMEVSAYVETDLIKDLNEIRDCGFIKHATVRKESEKDLILMKRQIPNLTIKPENISGSCNELYELFELFRKFEEKNASDYPLSY